MRIASLLASSTEIVAALGLQDQLVGVSHSCDFPKEVKNLPILTSALFQASSAAEIDAAVREKLTNQAAIYALDTPRLETLAPDLVISQAICDVCAVSGDEVAIALRRFKSPPVLINLEPFSLSDILDTIIAIGNAAKVPDKAIALRKSLQTRIDAVKLKTQNINPSSYPGVIVLDWTSPPFFAGHWMDELITISGGRNLDPHSQTPSYTTDWNTIIEMAPQRLVIAACGFTAKRTLDDIKQDKNCRDALKILTDRQCQIAIFDGLGLFSRSGPRIVDSLELLAHWFWPQIHQRPNIAPEMGPIIVNPHTLG